jgi:hypothetical protein
MDSHAVDVSVDYSALHFVLADGREIFAPLDGFPDYGMPSLNKEKNGG